MPPKMTSKNTKSVRPMTMPPRYSPEEFVYKGRPAKDQDDFGSDVGLADMVHIDKDGVTSLIQITSTFAIL